jgi:hypothetical protein
MTSLPPSGGELAPPPHAQIAQIPGKKRAFAAAWIIPRT